MGKVLVVSKRRHIRVDTGKGKTDLLGGFFREQKKKKRGNLTEGILK